MRSTESHHPISVSQIPLKRERVDLIPASEISLLEIRWLWSDWIARAKFHLLAGDAGTGKTTLAIAIAATISSGGTWPDGSAALPGNVLIWSGEDDACDTIVPRLTAAGANLDRVFVVGEVRSAVEARPFDPAYDLEMLAVEASRIGEIALVIVDPVISAVAGDSHKNAEVRRSLQPLVDLACRLDAAVLGISHFSKMATGGDPLLRVTGSVAFGAVARVVLVAAKRGDEGSRVLARAKSNIGPDEGGFNYEIDVSDGTFSASFVKWGEALEGAARELLAGDGSAQPAAAEDALAWLQAFLASGPQSVRCVRAAAEQCGIRWRTLERAKQSLGIRSTKHAPDGGWLWSLPAKQGCEDRQDRQAERGGLGGLDAPGGCGADA